MKKTEDIEKTAPDHSADAVHYVLTAVNQKQHGWRVLAGGSQIRLY
jgi:hypothetical protein